MSGPAPTDREGRANWRRKWKRTPAHLRRQASGSLADVFARRRRRGGPLAVLLIVALAAHAGLLPLIRTSDGRELPDLAERGGYLRRVVQAERARHVSRHLARRVSMPPPPAVPEAVVSETLSGEITASIERVIGDMMDVKVTSALAEQVAGSLREELAAAAKDIAGGSLSPAEVRALREEFTRKAHRRTVSALKRHREKTQVARAKLSVKEWYETRVSPTLRRKIQYELFEAYHKIWPGTYGRGRFGVVPLWYGEVFGFRRKVGELARLIEGRHQRAEVGGRPLGHGWRLLPDWPKASAAQAEGMIAVARSIQGGHEGGGRGGSWAGCLRAYARGYRAHEVEAVLKRCGEPAEALWEEFFRRAGAYREKAAGGADDVREARRACLETLRKIHRLGSEALVPDEPAYVPVNRAIARRVLLGPERDRVYSEFVETLIEALAPAVRDMAENEFQEGILIRREGIDGVTRAFADETLELLRRDVETPLPKRRFDDLLFEGGPITYTSEATGKTRPPTAEEIAAEEAALKKTLASWPEDRRAYVARRREIIGEQFRAVVAKATKELLARLVEDGRFHRRFYAAVESVDYTDKVRQRLNARARALAGRGQDLGSLTEEGVPDTSAPMVALLFGATRGHGASLEPTAADMVCGFAPQRRLRGQARSGPPRLPPPPWSWGRVTQPDVDPPFQAVRCEGIPFLANFPRLDGDLRDWGRIRPLVLQNQRWQDEPKGHLLVYAAWNYQGFFFGYRVDQPASAYCLPGPLRRDESLLGELKPRGTYGTWAYGWAYKGDYFRVLFDTLDARSELRGEKHLQEFVILPRGIPSNPAVPGMERIIDSRRYATIMIGQWHGNKARCRIFPPQPGRAEGPDGTGPYRVCRFGADGYTVEAFLPRSLFNVPVFCPGWYLGFECFVGIGRQTRRGHGQIWANPRGGREYGGGIERNDYPALWGDLLLLGTDPQLAVQDADGRAVMASGIVPGHSYLLTVMDPDRNIHLTAPDTVVVSAEVVRPGAAGATGRRGDVEVFILRETGPNTSVFRGFVDTQPGDGREVAGVLELLPGRRVRLGYVDLANAEGARNVVYHLDLPVLAGVSAPVAVAR